MQITSTNTPKIFISYSWSNPAHQEFVLRLAERLMSDGVHVLLDRWDLQQGQDKYVFMEKMVTDSEISKVIVISDKKYAEKADSRLGGVGTESQIISDEVYTKVDQTKFIPVVTEYQDNKPCLPYFLKSRIYIDFSDESKIHDEYEKLLRSIYERPANSRPPIGKPPAYLFEINPTLVITASTFTHLRYAIEQGKTSITALSNQFRSQLLDALESLRITSNDNIDDKIVEAIDSFRPYRNQFVEITKLLSEYSLIDQQKEELREFFEAILNFHYAPSNSSSNYTGWFDGYKFITMELYTYAIATLIKFKKYSVVNYLLSEKYTNPNRRGDRLYTYCGFNNYIRILDEYRNETKKLNRLSVTADILHDHANTKIISFSEYMQADFILCVRSLLDESSDDRWFPRSIIYKDVHDDLPFPLFLRAESKQGFEIIKEIFEVISRQELEMRFNRAYEKYNLGNWVIDYRPIPFRTLLNLNNIYMG